MEFLLGALLGAIIGWGITTLFRQLSAEEKVQKWYYVCPMDDCIYTYDSHVKVAVESAAEQHEMDHIRRESGLEG